MKCTIQPLIIGEPKTGRTHQIRVHLQYLGFPIANDPHYNVAAWGENLGKGGNADCDKTQLIEAFQKQVFPGDSNVLIEGFDGCMECLDERKDPKPEMLNLWLHSLKYEGEGWAYETKYPAWAQEGWTGDADVEERFWNFGGRWDGEAPGEFTQD